MIRNTTVKVHYFGATSASPGHSLRAEGLQGAGWSGQPREKGSAEPQGRGKRGSPPGPAILKRCRADQETDAVVAQMRSAQDRSVSRGGLYRTKMTFWIALDPLQLVLGAGTTIMIRRTLPVFQGNAAGAKAHSRGSPNRTAHTFSRSFMMSMTGGKKPWFRPGELPLVWRTQVTVTNIRCLSRTKAMHVLLSALERYCLLVNSLVCICDHLQYSRVVSLCSPYDEGTERGKRLAATPDVMLLSAPTLACS